MPTLGEAIHSQNESRKVFPKVDEIAMKIGLEEALKYIINIPPVEFNLSQERAREIKEIYSAVSRMARQSGIDTRDYDLTFDRQLKEHTFGR